MNARENHLDRTAAVADHFRRFADHQCGDAGLYRTLALGIAGDRALLELAAHCRPGQPPPNLLLGAVHHLLLRGARHGLAAYYPTIVDRPRDPAGALPVFADFCREHRAAILPILAERIVQTNEPGRGAILLPALRELRSPQPLALVEVGASAGLLLHLDRYRYEYSDGTADGDPDSPVTVRCDRLDDRKLPAAPIAIARRIGIDLRPPDLGGDDADWLRALVWPDHPERLARLTAALATARANPADVRAGDALALLPGILAELPAAVAPVVYHCFVVYQFSEEGRARLYRIIADASGRDGREREVHALWLEGFGAPAEPSAEAAAAGASAVAIRRRFVGGRLAEERVVARFHPHGRGLQWLG